MDNPSKIGAVLKKWAFEPTDSMGRCGSDYLLLFYKDNVQIDYSYFCFQCNRLVFEDLIFEISQTEILRLLNNDFIPVYKHKKAFQSIEEGRIFWKEMKNQSEIICIQKKQPLWLKYDGKFQVNFSLNISSREEAEKFLTNQLQSALKTQEYKLRFASKKPSEEGFNYKCYVYGSKKLYDSIEGVLKQDWKELQNPELELLYKNNPE
jgi:hypothetical protein